MNNFITTIAPLFDAAGTSALLARFTLNTLVTWLLVHFLYYRKSRRTDYYFTFLLISISVFLLIFLLGSVNIKLGLALGLFAIFGIIRYRTETMPVREMTYLFMIIAISVINALALTLSMVEIALTNLLFLVPTWVCESNRWLRHVSCKLVLYDRIDLIKPDNKNDLIADLRQRTGLEVVKVEVGSIDFLRDTAMLKIYYDAPAGYENTVDNLTKLPKHDE